MTPESRDLLFGAGQFERDGRQLDRLPPLRQKRHVVSGRVPVLRQGSAVYVGRKPESG